MRVLSFIPGKVLGDIDQSDDLLVQAGELIGSLDACVIAGYPGSIASLWQQSGRAGRRGGRSLTVYVDD